MQDTPTRSIFSEITDFLATNPTPRAIIAYELPEEFRSRAHDLLERHNADDLTREEYEEMLDFVRVEEMMSLLKAKMKVKLAKASDE